MKNANFFSIQFLVAICLIYAPLQSGAQFHEKIGQELRNFLLEVDENFQIPLLVEGTHLGEIVEKYNGKVRLQLQNLYSIQIPAKHVREFALTPTLTQIEFSNASGHLLNDTMLIQINADSIHKSFFPLGRAYTGKGVLIGFIDTGIEINHPDFQDSLGNTRISYIWDQRVPYNPNSKPGSYSYGVEWNSSDIDGGVSTHDDQASQFGHGSMVAGAAASNGLASGQFKGVAPESNIIMIASNLQSPNWLQTIVESVDYIFKKADSLNMPCVINASVGTYSGSHDGKDIAARMIDLLIHQKSGRAMVAAAGNAGSANFHLQQQANNDTVFTWFKVNPTQFSGLGGVYFEIWSDTADFQNLQIALGADKLNNGKLNFRGRTNFFHPQNALNQITVDSILSPLSNKIAIVNTYSELNQGRYKIEVAIVNPDSSQYVFRLESKGIGKIDVWSSRQYTQSSDMISDSLPSTSQFPIMLNYRKPDSLQTLVSSFTCLPSVITVGNYINRNTYLDYNGNLQTMNYTPGSISPHSSLGPSRTNYLKPDLCSAGDFMLSAGRIATMNQLKTGQPSKISQDGWHMRNGGTSMAAPTVAGIAALVFELCPNITADSLKEKLLLKTKKDGFTGASNNPTWGNGKADAFQTMINLSFQVNTVVSQNWFCSGDSISIGLSGIYSKYLWSNGDSSSTTFIKNSGNYYSFATNTLGCKVSSDTVSISQVPSPIKSLIAQQNDTLSVNGAGTYQWFFNNQAISLANSSFIKVSQNGNYFCQITDPNTSCSTNSDTIYFSITNLKTEFKINPTKLAIYPNPNDGSFRIEDTTEEDIQEIELFSLTGQLLWSKIIPTPSKQMTLNLRPISNGIYLLHIKRQKQNSIQKLVIQ